MARPFTVQIIVKRRNGGATAIGLKPSYSQVEALETKGPLPLTTCMIAAEIERLTRAWLDTTEADYLRQLAHEGDLDELTEAEKEATS